MLFFPAQILALATSWSQAMWDGTPSQRHTYKLAWARQEGLVLQALGKRKVRREGPFPLD